MPQILRLAALAAAAALAACGARDQLSTRVSAHEIQAEQFGASRIQVRANRVLVRRMEGRANAMGVVLRLGADAPEGHFAATFRVQGDGRAALRTQADGQTRYAAGDEGIIRIGGGVEEVVLYSDSATSMDIELGALLDCSQTDEGPCYTIDNLRREIFPDGEPDDRREHLLALLHWASNAVDQASHSGINEIGKRYASRYDAATMYSVIYRPDIAGGYCGAHAVFFAKLLRDFGYDAMTINYGRIENDLTHVSTLVFSPFGDGRFYLLDPTFNAHIINRATQEWAPFDDVLRLPPQRFQLVTASMSGRDFLFSTPEEAENIGGYTDCAPNAAGDVVRCSRPSYSIADYYQSFGPFLTAAGFPANDTGFLLLLRTQYFSVGRASEEARAALTALFARNGILLERARAQEGERGT